MSFESDLAIIDKRRPKANVSEVMNAIGEVTDRNGVIMDDMVDTAGTLVKAAQVLKEEGVTRVVAYCTHLRPLRRRGRAHREVAPRRARRHRYPFPSARRARVPQNPQSVRGGPLCRDDLVRIYTEESVSSLFIE